MSGNANEIEGIVMNALAMCDAATPAFKIAGDSLFDFVSSMPEPAHVKDSEDGSYIFSNESNLEIYGLTKVEQIIGATVHDLDGFMRPFWGKEFANCIDLLDYRVKYKKETVADKNRIFLDKFGLLHIQNMTKVPVLNDQNQVTAVLTLSFDLTRKTDSFKLLNLYKSIYMRKSEAVSYFTRYLRIDQFFNEKLTEKELLCLLHMKRNRCHKSIARSMDVGVKTVETHVSHIISKSTKYGISDILVFLRDN